MIDKSKTYRTRDGREVRIYATDGNGLRPVHGAYKSRDGHEWIPTSWEADGLYGEDTNHYADLIEVRPRIKQEVWLNVYRARDGTFYSDTSLPTKEKARRRGPSACACIPFTIDCEEGEGL